jgi:hypothetical protein
MRPRQKQHKERGEERISVTDKREKTKTLNEIDKRQYAERPRNRDQDQKELQNFGTGY